MAKAGRVLEMKHEGDCLVVEVPVDALTVEVQLQIQTKMWGMIQPMHGTMRNGVVESK